MTIPVAAVMDSNHGKNGTVPCITVRQNTHRHAPCCFVFAVLRIERNLCVCVL